MNSTIRIGLLDFCNLADDGDAVLGLLNIVDTAKTADRLGFHRYWLGEHWTGDTCTPCADVLTPIIAGVTQNIRVGPAGVLLNLYSPLKVASDALLASGLFPDRIDWGIARGIVADDKRKALVSAAEDITNPEVYVSKVAELMDFLARREELGIQPVNARLPEMWILGAGGRSAPLAGRVGAGFAIALFFGSDREDVADALTRYRLSFAPAALRSDRDQPKTVVAIAGACTESRKEAEQIERTWRNRYIRPNLVGPPDAFRQGVLDLGVRYGVDEIVLLDVSPTQSRKLRSLELIAETFGLA